MMPKQQVRDAVAEALRAPYARVLEREEDGGWSAEVLEFPGCFASGDTLEEVMQNLEAAMEDWVAVAIEQGDDVPGPIAAREYHGQIALRVPPSLHRRLALLAAAEHVSMNRWIADAVSGAAAVGHARVEEGRDSSTAARTRSA